MNSKTASYVFGLLLLVVFSGFAFVQFNEALTPYVSYEQAIASPRTVQVAGGLQKGSSSYDEREGRLHFTLVDTENVSKTLAVRYEGVKPANFEEAISIVAIGNWDGESKEFAAHDLLVKCPSKYQGLDDYESKSYSAGEGQAGYGESYEQGPADASVGEATLNVLSSDSGLSSDGASSSNADEGYASASAHSGDAATAPATPE